MKKVFLYIIAFVSIIVFQFGVLNWFTYPVSSAIIPLALLCIGVHLGLLRSIIFWPVSLGVAWDMLSVMPFGVYTVTFVLTAYVTLYVFSTVVTDISFFSFTLLSSVSMATYVAVFSVSISIAALFTSGLHVGHGATLVLQSAIITLVFAMMLYSLVRIIFRRLMPTHI